MLKKIAPFYNPKNICIENIYVSICNAINTDFKNMYAYAWNFGYKKIDDLNNIELFGKRIMPSRDGQGLNSEENYALEAYCGVKPIWHMNCEFKNFIKIVKKELENGNPVAIGTDIFVCNWHKAYNKYHSIHYCLIIGIEDDGFICIDDTLASKDGNLILEKCPKNVKIPFNTLEKFKYGFITFKINSHSYVHSNDELLYLSTLKTLTGFKCKSDFDYMRDLMSDIEKYLDIDAEIYGFEDVWAIDIIRCFNYIIWSRKNYCVFLKNMDEPKKIDIENVMNIMNNSIKLWEEIKNYIMKYAIDSSSQFDKSIICNNLNEIITIEENLANYILKSY